MTTPGTKQAQPSTTQTPAQEQRYTVKVFFVKIDDNGKTGRKIGCNDSLIPVTRSVVSKDSALKVALTELLTKKDGEPGLYNVFTQSDLTVENAILENGKATIYLKGTYSFGGVCDTPRFKEQLIETAKQFGDVKDVSFFINNIPLDKALSAKG
ncbi:MAG: GerMN domain-containing protein [Candidatus Levybacteria bacterium]|nr:GerMN domain-containing protein [Candidatus Levybacteria bacterium]